MTSRPTRAAVVLAGLTAVIAMAGCASQASAVCNLPAMQPPNVMLYASAFMHEHPKATITVRVDGAVVETLRKKQVTTTRYPNIVVVGTGSDKAVTPSPHPIQFELDVRDPNFASKTSSRVLSLHNAYKALHGACTATLWTATVRVSSDGTIL